MKIFNKLTFVIIMLLVVKSTLLAGSSIAVGFIQNKEDSASGTVTLKITNTTKKSIKVLKWNTAFEKTLSANIFAVKNGKKLSVYQGRLIKRNSPTDDDYITLEAGEERSVSILLPKYYEMTKEGTYEVIYNGSFKVKNQKNFVKKSLKSLTVKTTIEFVPSEKKSLSVVEKLPSQFNGCSLSEITLLNAAHIDAIDITESAYDTMVAASELTTGERYNTWFGAPNQSRQDTVTSNLNSIHSALDTQEVVFDCTCDESYYAHVYPSQPYTIYLCSAFWGAPATGTDSKAGVVVHEMAHFTVVAGTDDHAYGHSNSKALAISNPANAIANSDSYEYFTENTPALTMNAVTPPLSPFETATEIWAILLDLPFNDSISTGGEVDMFTFIAPRSGEYEFYTTGDLDTMGTVFNSLEEEIAFNDDDHDAIGLNFRLSIVLTEGETYYLKVEEWGDGIGDYTLNSKFRGRVKGDFNGDGISDLMVRNLNTGRIVNYMMNTEGRKESAVGITYLASSQWETID